MENHEETIRKLSVKSTGTDCEDAKLVKTRFLRCLPYIWNLDQLLSDVESEALCCGTDETMICHEELEDMSDRLMFQIVRLDPRFDVGKLETWEIREAALAILDEYKAAGGRMKFTPSEWRAVIYGLF